MTVMYDQTAVRAPTLAGAPPSGKPPKPPRPPKPPKPPKGERPPKPPRRVPRPPVQYAPLSPGQAVVRGILALVAILTLAFVVYLVGLSHIQYLAAQQQLSDVFRAQLAEGTAPVSEGDFDDVLLADGAPVALLTIPQLGISQIVAEGTSSGKQFRLRGKGMSVLRSRDHGDLYIQVAVETPQNLTRRQRELLMEFDRESSKDTSPESSGFFARMKDFFDGIGGTGRA